MLEMWNVSDVGCWGCRMLGMWDVQDVGCLGSGMFGMRDVRDVGCWGCGMFGMWDVGCGMFAGMRDVDLQNARNLVHTQRLNYCLIVERFLVFHSKIGGVLGRKVALE